MIERYRKSADPVDRDGRDIDPEVGRLSGEGASQVAAASTDKHVKEMSAAWEHRAEPASDDPTYYERPMLHESVWTWAVPLYYYVGGLSGASMALGAAAALNRAQAFDDLVQRCHIIGLAGTVVSGGLLIYDLGRPSRFLNMLRVFRPTSPMNMGAWILTATGGTAFVTVVLRDQRGVLGSIGEAFGFISGLFGLGLATYTGVLIANTAVPAWQASRKSLPVLFGASAVASLGCAFDVFGERVAGSRIPHAFGIVGRAAEVGAGIYTEHEASAVSRVGRPLKQGWSGVLWRTSALLMATSLGLALLPTRTRKRRVWSGVLGSVASLLMRFSVEAAGKASARDPRASFYGQREQ
jgi:formate-dependent nitrite reductase membrane component NrfD